MYFSSSTNSIYVRVYFFLFFPVRCHSTVTLMERELSLLDGQRDCALIRVIVIIKLLYNLSSLPLGNSHNLGVSWRNSVLQTYHVSNSADA